MISGETTRTPSKFQWRHGGPCLITIVWLGAVIFSSTSVAGKWADDAFLGLWRTILSSLYGNDPYEQHRLHFLAEKSIHFLMFSILAVILWSALDRAKWKGVQVLLIGVSIGICTEILQSFFPGRDPSLRDALINMAGTTAGVSLAYAHSRVKRTGSKATRA